MGGANSITIRQWMKALGLMASLGLSYMRDPFKITFWPSGTLCTQTNPVHITTDASTLVWGSHMVKHLTQGKWNPQWVGASSNIRELKVVKQVLKLLIQGKDVQIQSNNATTVAWQQTFGSKVPLSYDPGGCNPEANIKLIWAFHLKGVESSLANYLTRNAIKRTD